MPIKTCQFENRPGYKWGDQGKCYTYDPQSDASRKSAKRKAIRQGVATGEFTRLAETWTDYPKAAREAAQTALRWADENGWGSCGTPVGKARANQLAKGEPISRETIARMAAFERHRDSSKRALGDGCGRLMWLAWGGDAGIAWAQRKPQQIDKK